MVQSSMRVRGIQVQKYLDEIHKPRVDIALDDKKGLLLTALSKTIIYDAPFEYCLLNYHKAL